MNQNRAFEDGKAQKAYESLLGHVILGKHCEWVSVEWLLECVRERPKRKKQRKR